MQQRACPGPNRPAGSAPERSSSMATVIVSLVVFGAVAFVIGKGIYNRVRRKGGECSCGGGCSGCPGSCLCHPEK